MEKSNAEKVKDFLLYAPVGAFGFVKDNAPTFFNMFVSRGKRDVNKSAMVAEEKIAESKEKGQIVAMGTPIAKEQAGQFAKDAKQKGESFAEAASEVAGAALSVASDFISSVVAMINDSESSENKAESVVEATESKPATNATEEAISDVTLPDDLKELYDSMSAPEIVQRLDKFSEQELRVIQKYEAGFRNRQTIIHAIAYRLNS